MNIMALVPARGGSKGIPRKNLINCAGKPLIQYTLDIVNELGDLVVPFVSTDDQEISDYCSRQGFDLSYRRPCELAQDDSPVTMAVFDAIAWYQQKKDLMIDAILLLQPTNPIRFVDELKTAICRFESQQLNSLVSVTPVFNHPYECLEVVSESEWLYLAQSGSKQYRRQSYPTNFYHVDGSFYLIKKTCLSEHNQFVIKGETQLFYLNNIPRIDIDEPYDLVMAEALLQNCWER